MLVLVNQQNVYSVLKTLSGQSTLSLDTETTGLRPFHGDRPFLFQIADHENEYIFDLGHYGPWHPDLQQLREFFAKPRYWYFANAKFDMFMLSLLGLVVAGEVHDLQAYERILDSNLFGRVFSLAATALRYGLTKDGSVDAYIGGHKLFTDVSLPGKKQKVRLLHYDRVPKEIMLPYAGNDARITFDICMAQNKRVAEASLDKIPELTKIVQNERKLTRTVFEMEQVGIQVNLDYCRCAAAHEAGRRAGLIERFQDETAVAFTDSAKCFAQVLDGSELRRNPPTPRFPAGSLSYDAESLELSTSPIAKLILDIRDAKSRSDYFHGFLYHADKEGVIHASFNQHQARNGRFSSSSPNLQNLTKPDDGDVGVEDFPVRRAFLPRPGFFFALFDFDQMEYRLMLEYAKCAGLIAKVLGGLDVHRATAELAGITRSQAKTTNFLTIYGGGDAILAQRLKLGVESARAIREAIFSAAPEMKTFIRQVQERARDRGMIFNWFGRRLYFPDKQECYRAPNYLIAGGCADVMKVAMNLVSDYLRTKLSRIVLTVHDELVVECAYGEEYIMPRIKEIMESVFPWKLLPLTCGADHSHKSLADKVKGLPI